MSQRLIIEDDEGTTTIVPLGKDAVTIGRQQGNTIQLTEKNVSRRHARLYPEQAAWVIEDLGSYNGIKVNGVPIDGRVTLKEGDVVQIGDYHLALTEDVDKRTLNYGSPAAANDPVGVEPMLASSSTDLPRLSADELAALQSGPHAVSPPALIDSGPVPATPVPHGFEERRKGGAGVLVGFGVVVAIALVAGIGWMAMSGGEDDPATRVAKNDEKPVAAKTEAKSDQAPPVDAKEPAPTPPPTGPANDDAAAVPADAEEGGEAPTEDPNPEAAGEEGEPEVVVPDENPETADDPPDASAKKKNPNKPKAKTTPIKKDAGTPPPPTPPAVDVAAMVADARKTGMTSPSKGYDLASKAFKAGGGREAAKLMALFACRIPDAGKAKTALKRLKGAERESIANICRDKGISV